MRQLPKCCPYCSHENLHPAGGFGMEGKYFCPNCKAEFSLTRRPESTGASLDFAKAMDRNPCGEVPLDASMPAGYGSDGHDVHKRRAAKLFDVPESEVTEDQRRIAKTRAFSEVYGPPTTVAESRRKAEEELKKLIDARAANLIGGMDFAKLEKDILDKCKERFPNHHVYEGVPIIPLPREGRCPHVLGDQNCKYPNLHQCSPGVECDKTKATCRDKFDNEKNFGGWPIFAEGGVVDGPKLFSDLFETNPHVVPRESILERMTRLRDASQKAHDKAEAALGDVLKDRAARPVTVGEHVERTLKKIRGSGEPITTVKPTHSPIEMIGELSSGIHPIFREYERRRGFTTHIDRVEYDGKTVGIFNEIPEVGEVHWWAHPHGIDPGAAAADYGTVSTVDDAVEEIKRVFNDTPQILRLKVTTKYQTTEACPVQWFGMLSNSQAFYARYRFGHLTVRVGRGHASEEELAAGELVFDERVGDTFDGEMSWERICELTPLEDR